MWTLCAIKNLFGDFEFCRYLSNDLFGILLNDLRVIVLNLYFSKWKFISPF